MAVAAELEATIARVWATIEEITTSQKASQEASQREAAERQKEAIERQKEINRLREETEKSQKRAADAIERLSETVEKTSQEVSEVIKGLSTLGHGIGTLVEFIVVPKIRPQMREVGRNYDDIAPNRRIKVNERQIAEVDLFLHGAAEAMAVEVKTRLKEADIKEHVARLVTLRNHENEAGIQGKSLYGAVVGVVIDDKARSRALEEGLYVVEIIEEKDKLKIDPPKIERVF